MKFSKIPKFLFFLCLLAAIKLDGQVNHIVISQVYGGGGNSGATYRNDFVELFNPTGSNVVINGWTIQYASASGTSWSSGALTGTIAPGRYYLVSLASGGAVGITLPTADASATGINMATAAGKVALVSNATALSGSCPTGTNIVDFVGFGTANCSEGSPTSAPTVTSSAMRNSNGCMDNNTNSTDFSVATVNPRNSSTSAVYCNPTKFSVTSVSPATPVAGSAFNVVVTAVDAGSNPSNVIANTSFSFTTNGNGGSLSGTITGIIAAGTNSVLVSGVKLSSAGTGVTLTANLVSGDNLASGTSATFSVAAAGGTPTKFVITSVSPSTPVAGSPVTVVVESQDAGNVAQFVSANTGFSLTTNGNAGSLGGSTTATILAGASSATVSGLTFANGGTGVTLTASRTTGDNLSSGSSSAFTVLGVATKLAFVNFPSSGTTSNNISTFTVEARRADNTVDVNFSGAITLTKLSGPGSLSGTTSVNAVAGVATYTAIQFDQAGSYVLTASSGTLTTDNSTSISIAQSPVSWNFTTASPSGGVPYGNLSVSSMTIGNSNGTVSGMLGSTAASSGYTGASGNNNAGNANKTGALSTAASGSGYFEFTLTPNAGYVVSVTGFSFGSRCTGTGPAAFTLRSSLDNYTSDIATGTLSTSGSWALYSPSVAQVISDLGSPVTYRLYGYNGSGSPSAGTINWRIDDVTLTLDVKSCTSPTAFNVTGGGAYCQNGSGVAIGLSGSETGVNYQLKQGNANIGSPVSGNGNPLSFGTFTATGTYTVVAINTAAGCKTNMTGSATVSINSNPAVTSNNGTICAGSNFTITGNGASTYSITGGNFVVSPSTVTSYTVTGTDGNGCSNTSVSTVSVNALPNVSSSSGAICTGDNYTITTSGASSYSITGGSFVVSPGTTASYTVTGTDGNGCSNTSVSTVSVNALPNVSSSSGAICAGDNYTISTSGASSYSITGGSFVVSPGTNTSYTVTGTDGNSCSNTSVSSVTVNTRPTVAITATSAVCYGANASLTASGANTYIWSNGSSAASIVVSPTVTSTYSVTGTDANGCSNTASQTVSVVVCPGPQFTGGVCGTTLSAIDQLLYFSTTAGATDYRIELTIPTTTYIAVNYRNTNVNQFRFSWLTDVQYNTTYQTRISAKVGGVWQAWGSPCTITTPGLPNTTQFNAGSCNITLSTLDQLLSFTGIAGATNYKMEIVSASQSFTTVNVRGNSATSFRLSWVSGVQYGRTYDIRISAYVNGAWQAYGSTCSITTPASIPLTQLSSTVCNTSVANRTTVFNFNPVAGASNYKVEVTPAAGGTSTISTRNSNLTTFALSYVTGTKVGVMYNLRVSSFVGGVWSAFGPICSVTALAAKEGADNTTISTRMGTENEIQNPIQVNVYPNPNNGEFYIDLNQNADIEITDVVGNVIFKQSAQTGVLNINMTEQENGIYFIKVNNQFTSKIIISK